MESSPITTRTGVTPPPVDENGYRTSPDQETTDWPPGVPYIVGNEACERFSFYGMNAILYVHLVALYQNSGLVEEVAKNASTATTHLFKAGVYALPMIGAILADRLVGKYRTIFYLSLVYCAGHAVLSLWDNTLMGMYVGLGLIAVGSGGIKPCVSANVGDQFGKGNWFRVRTVFQIFYFSINFGSFFSTLLIPWTREAFSAKVAFAIPGILMFIATIIFWLGRRKFVHVPPRPGGQLGLLDTLSSVSLFLAVGHLFFTGHYLAWYWLPPISLAFLALGLWLFWVRQQQRPDDGFLAITLYALGRLFRSGPEPAPMASAGDKKAVDRSRAPVGVGGTGITPAPQVTGVTTAPQVTGVTTGPNPPGNGPADPPEDDYLRDHWFWGPAARRFGPEATEGPIAVLKVISIFLMVSVFWALFDQHSTSWIRQADLMDLTVLSTQQVQALGIARFWDGTLLPSQVPALNPLLVMLLIPLMNLVYNGVDRLGIQTTPLRRMTVGMFIASLSFVAVAVLQGWINQAGVGQVPIAWQILPYVLITVAEVMVSITGLEFAYTQAPRRMKSTVMGFWLLTVTLGNVLVAFLAGLEGLALVNFFWVFAGLMAGAGLIFGLRALVYVPKDYAQD